MSVTAILLAAGYGTRLYPLTKDRPKALLPLGKGVILDAVLTSLKSISDLTRCILVTNHRFAEQFRKWQRTSGFEFTVLDDQTETPETRLGAIRDLELARKKEKVEEDLLVAGTDNLFEWSMQDFVSRSQRRWPNACVALGSVPSREVARQCGVVDQDSDGRLISFIEKPPEPASTVVAHCVYFFPEAMCGKIQQFVDEGGNPDAPGYFIEWLIGHGGVFGTQMSGSWFDIGSPDSYEKATKAWAKSNSHTSAGNV